MTLVIADTKAQADHWIRQLEIEDGKFVNTVDHVLGCRRDTTEIIAVGPLLNRTTFDLIFEIRRRGFKVEYLPETGG